MKLAKAVICIFLLASSCSCTSPRMAATTFSSIALYQGLHHLSCMMRECCTKLWRPANITRLNQVLKENLVGQHLVQDVVVRALSGYTKNPEPNKPLVISFHGWTGSGKNFVSKFVAESFYHLGFNSKFVHVFIAGLHFPNAEHTTLYKDQLRDWIKGNVSLCGDSLFIFDEVDKMPPGVLDGIKPYLDHYENIDGVDYRRAVFIFLSNTGGKAITKTTLDSWKSGKDRNSITYTHLDPLIAMGAFNEEGGLHGSSVIKKSLVDVYIPFLPLERRHVKLCAKNELEMRGVVATDELTDRVADQLSFWPEDLRLFSKSGCKRVAQKVDLILESDNLVFKEEL